MRRAARRWSGLAFVAATWGAKEAHAAPWSFEWDAPPECPSAREVEAEVTRRLTAPATDLSVRAAVRPAPSGYRVELRMSGAVEGVRSLEAPTCASAARATALIVLLALEPGAAASLAARLSDEPLPDEPKPGGEPPAPGPERKDTGRGDAERAAPETEPRAASDASPPEGRGAWRAALAAALLSEIAWVPGVAWGAAGWFGVATPHFSVGLVVGGVPSVTVSGAESSGAEGLAAHLGWGFAGVRACATHRLGLELAACGRVRGAFLSASGSGSADDQAASAFAALVEPGLAARWIGPQGLGVELAGFATFPLEHHRFVFVRGAGEGATSRELELFRLAPGASLTLALDFRF